jgi:hypothetical protein
MKRKNAFDEKKQKWTKFSLFFFCIAKQAKSSRNNFFVSLGSCFAKPNNTLNWKPYFWGRKIPSKSTWPQLYCLDSKQLPSCAIIFCTACQNLCELWCDHSNAACQNVVICSAITSTQLS